MKLIQSLYLRIVINIQRLIDHQIRHLTGLPQLKRSEIAPELFLGGQYNMHGVETMKKLGITGIINMRTVRLHDDKLTEFFRLLHLPTPDRHSPTATQLKRGVEFINSEMEKKGKVYVHCRHGEGRGPTMVIAYLISRGMTYDDALVHVQKVRTFVNPTLPQAETLRKLETTFKKKS